MATVEENLDLQTDALQGILLAINEGLREGIKIRGGGSEGAEGGKGKASGSGLLTLGAALSGSAGLLFGALEFAKNLAFGVVKVVGGLLGGAAAAFVAAVKISSDALGTYSRNVLRISDETGQSIRGAQLLTNRFAAYGIGSDATAGIFGSRFMAPQLMGARARAMGAPDASLPNFGSNLAKWFQNQAKTGLGGFLSARARLDALFGGQAPAEVLRLANSNPRALAANEAYSNQTQRQLGIGPNAIRAAGEGLPLLITRIGIFVDAVKTRFAAELLPTMERTFKIVSDLLIRNAGSIAAGIRFVTEWLFVKLPTILVSAGQTAINWGRALTGAFFSVALAAASLLDGLAGRKGAFYSVLMSSAHFIDTIAAQGRVFSAVLAGIATTLGNVVLLSPALNLWARYSGITLPNPGNPVAVYKAYLANAPKSNLVGALNAGINSGAFANASGTIRNLAVRGQANSNAIFNGAQSGLNYVKSLLGTEQERKDLFHQDMRELIETVQESNGYLRAIDGGVNRRGYTNADDVLAEIADRAAARFGRLGRRGVRG